MLQTLDRGLVRANRAVLIVLLAAMSVIVFANVALRYLSDESILWAEELSRYLMIWLTFLGSGLVLRHGGHLAIDNLQDVLPTGGARAVRGLILLCVVGFAGAMGWIGVNYVIRTWNQTTPVMELPFGFVYTAIPAGAALIILHALALARPFILERRFEEDENFDANASASL